MILYEDFDQAGNGADEWGMTDWTEVTSTTTCVNDANDDCIRSNTNDNPVYYSSDINVSACDAGTLWVSGWTYDYACDSGEDLSLGVSANSGSNWNWQVVDLGSGATGSGTFNVTLGDTNISSTFRIGFDTISVDSGEYFDADNVRIGCVAEGESICLEIGVVYVLPAILASATPTARMRGVHWIQLNW